MLYLVEKKSVINIIEKFLWEFSSDFWWWDMNLYLCVSAFTSGQSPLQCFTKAKNKKIFPVNEIKLIKFTDRQEYGGDEKQ